MVDQELSAIAAMRDVLATEPDPIRHFDPDEAKRILRDSGWSAESAARVLGVSSRSVAGWLANEHAPSGQHAPSWQRLLAVLSRATAVRSTRLQEGVERLLREVRRTAEIEEVAA